MRPTAKKNWLFGMSISLFISCVANANNNCNFSSPPNNYYDRSYCLAKLFVASDNQLNDTYQQLRKRLSDGQKDRLNLGQRIWLDYRSSQCLTDNKFDLECNLEINNARITYLQSLIKKCDAGHCDVRHSGYLDNQRYSCYWMEKKSGNFKWVLAERIKTKNECYFADSCNGGVSGSRGGCYKWATSPDGQRAPWYRISGALTTVGS